MIELKNYQLDEIISILNKVQLNKITDAEMRKNILKFVLLMPKKLESVKSEIDETRKKFFGEFKEEDLNKFQIALNEISELIKDGKTTEALKKDAEVSKEFPEIVTAYKNFNDAINYLQKETVELTLEPIKVEDFIDAMTGQDITISAKEINILNPIFVNES